MRKKSTENSSWGEEKEEGEEENRKEEKGADHESAPRRIYTEHTSGLGGVSRRFPHGPTQVPSFFFKLSLFVCNR